MISKEALAAFRARPAADSDLVKRFDESRLDRGLKRLSAHWTTPPRLHQKAALYLGLKFPSFEFICDPGCLSGDTLVDCPRDLVKYPKGIPIQELVGKQPWVYAWRDGRIVVVRASRVWLAERSARTVRVVLGSHKNANKHYLAPLELVGTADHPVLLADLVTWKPLGELKPGDRLCSLYRSRNNRTSLNWTGAPELSRVPWGPRRGVEVCEHSFVCGEVHGPRPQNHEVHHLNEQKFDHSPENLEWKTTADHTRGHQAGQKNGFFGKRHDEATREKMRGANRRFYAAGGRGPMQGKQHSEEAKANMRRGHARSLAAGKGMFGRRHTEETKAKMRAARARNNHIVLDVQDSGLRDVYDMTVPGADSFVANGVVVHNCGKTKISLDLVQSRGLRALVLVPFSTNIGGWKEETELHAPGLQFAGLDGSRAERERALRDPANDVTAVTYAGLLSLVCDRVKKGGDEKGLKFNAKKVDELARLFGIVIPDECSAIRNAETLIFRVLRRVRKRVRHFYLLSGTPFDRRPDQLWPQFYLLDQGETLGESQGLMREAWFSATHGYWGGTTYKLMKSRTDEFRQRLRNRSVRYESRECLDLPEAVGGVLADRFMIRKVRWPEEAWTYYEKLLAKLAAERGEGERKDTFIRMRQVASGYLPVKSESGEVTVIRFERAPKLDALIELLGELDPDHKVIVYNHYRLTGELVAARLSREGIPTLRVYSETPRKSAVVNQWKNDKETRVLLGSLSIAYGLNLQKTCNQLIVYESPTAWNDRVQLEKRINRDGQTKPTFCWDLATENSVELRILKALREGQDLFDELMRAKDPRKLLES